MTAPNSSSSDRRASSTLIELLIVIATIDEDNLPMNPENRFFHMDGCRRMT